MKIILFGPPGAGKGTQASLVTQKYNMVHIATGDILRAAVKNGTELGQKAKSFMDKGELVPDDVVIDIIKGQITNSGSDKGFMLDGFPRTIPQARALDSVLEGAGLGIDAVISIEVDDTEILNRIRERQKIEGRGDDSADVASNRLSVYRKQAEPIKGYYASAGKLMEVDGIGAVKEVFERIESILGSLN
ncbi:MAG: adenylate kinase [Candidatus Dadabacteria bacterium]|nr:adenylate kinase [Candidatus Dadabacteria bacterium]